MIKKLFLFIVCLAYANSLFSSPSGHGNHIREYDNYSPLTKLAYSFLTERDFLPKENSYGVIGISTLAIEQALAMVLNKPVVFVGGNATRGWVRKATALFNSYKDSTKTPICILNEGYLKEDNESVVLDSFLVVDATWLPQMQKTFEYPANVYIFSGTYLTTTPVKLSFAFFSDEKLAEQVKERLIFLHSGLRVEDLQTAEIILQSPDVLDNRIKKMHENSQKAFEALMQQVELFNDEEDTTIQIVIDSQRYLYLKGDMKKLNSFLQDNKDFLNNYKIKEKSNQFIYSPIVKENMILLDTYSLPSIQEEYVLKIDPNTRDVGGVESYKKWVLNDL